MVNWGFYFLLFQEFLKLLCVIVWILRRIPLHLDLNALRWTLVSRFRFRTFLHWWEPFNFLCSFICCRCFLFNINFKYTVINIRLSFIKFQYEFFRCNGLQLLTIFIVKFRFLNTFSLTRFHWWRFNCSSNSCCWIFITILLLYGVLVTLSRTMLLLFMSVKDAILRNLHISCWCFLCNSITFL